MATDNNSEDTHTHYLMEELIIYPIKFNKETILNLQVLYLLKHKDQRMFQMLSIQVNTTLNLIIEWREVDKTLSISCKRCDKIKLLSSKCKAVDKLYHAHRKIKVQIK